MTLLTDCNELFNRIKNREISNTDPKAIGDRVTILDLSSATDTEGNEYEYNALDFRRGCVVIEKIQGQYRSFKQDLLLHCPATGQKIMINSKHVKRV